jgi:hypothetical protein
MPLLGSAQTAGALQVHHPYRCECYAFHMAEDAIYTPGCIVRPEVFDSRVALGGPNAAVAKEMS